MSRFLPIALVLATIATTVPAGEVQYDARKAAQLAQQTGRPLLTIAGSTGCVFCREIKQQIATDPAVGQLANNYIICMLDVKQPMYDAWTAAYPRKGNGIPALWVVRADGTVLQQTAGKPRDVAGYLKSHLEKAGTILPLDKLQTMLAAQKTYPRKSRSEQIKLVNEYAGTGSYAQVALFFDQARDNLLTSLDTDLARIDRELSTTETEFTAATDLLRAQTDYADIPEAVTKIDAALTKYRDDEAVAPLLAAVEQLEAAKATERKLDFKTAIEEYKQVIELRSAGPAADYARDKVERLSKLAN